MNIDLLYTSEQEELLRAINWMHTDDGSQIDRHQIREMIVNDDCYISVLEQLKTLKQLGYITILELDQDNEIYILSGNYDMLCAKINQIYSNKRKEFAKETAKLVSSLIP